MKGQVKSVSNIVCEYLITYMHLAFIPVVHTKDKRGKSSSREHLSVKDYKEITNYEKSKQTLEDIKIELPNVPNIKNFGKLTVKRDERI